MIIFIVLVEGFLCMLSRLPPLNPSHITANRISLQNAKIFYVFITSLYSSTHVALRYVMIKEL